MANPTRKAALLVVDMQEDFCPPNGSLAIEGGRDLAPKINELLEMPGFTLKLATRDAHPADHISFASQHPGKQAFTSSHTIKNPENPDETQTTVLWPDHCIDGTPGSNIIPELASYNFTHIVNKGQDKRVESYSAFGPPFRNPSVAMSDLDSILKQAGITDVFTVGLTYDFCVKSTAVDAAKLGYRTFVLEDVSASAERTEEGYEKTAKEYREGGVRIIKMDSEELEFARRG